MTTKTIDIKEAQKRLTELLTLVQAGTEVVLTVNDKPLARIVPVAKGAESRPRIPGLHADKGPAWMSDDFDEPLPDEFWTGAS